MKGLAAGEQSNTDRPILQLFCRDAGFLADFDSGTFIVEDVSTGTPSTVVATTTFIAGHKLGTGRYAITTGDTASWNQGYHRAVCTYKMSATGQDYVQVIPFEILNAADWPTGMAYSGYISTRQAQDDSFIDITETTLTIAQRYINRISRQIEMWTRRFFEPRFMCYKRSGQNDPTLLIDEAIIAIEDIYAVWQTTSGSDTYKFEQYLYKVFNRHLDGYFAEDDRHNPRIVLTDVDGDIVDSSGWSWPYGNQNIELRGVFGYTETELDPSNGNVIVGQTPMDIAAAVGALLYRYVEDPTLSNPAIIRPGAVKSMRTRDQSISFGGDSSGSTAPSDLSGDPLIDAILVKYCAPVPFGAT